MVMAACMASTGRRRLPPAKVEWRIAPWIEVGTVSMLGSNFSSARSVNSAPSRISVFTSAGIPLMITEDGIAIISVYTWL